MTLSPLPPAARTRPDIARGDPRPAAAAAYLLGGRGHGPADRAFAENLVSRSPGWTADLRATQQFTVRALRALGEQRFTRVIDLSTPLPSPEGPYHALPSGRSMRLVRLDPDPDTAARARELLEGTAHRVLQVDPGQPQDAAGELRRLRWLEPGHPVVLVATAGTLESHALNVKLVEMLAGWSRELPAGSLLLFSHDTDDGRSRPQATAAQAARALYSGIGREFAARPTVELLDLLHRGGWQPRYPVGRVDQWRSGTPQPGRPRPQRHTTSVSGGIAEIPFPPHGRPAKATSPQAAVTPDPPHDRPRGGEHRRRSAAPQTGRPVHGPAGDHRGALRS